MIWTPPKRPDWLATFNREGRALSMPMVAPLTPKALLDAATQSCGLNDFGDASFGGDTWQEPFELYCESLESEAELTPFGRLMTRNDLLNWLTTRLNMVELVKRHPEIREQVIAQPMFIVGLPRSGTSILFEVLSQDPQVGVPQMWESIFPCPPPTPETYASDPRIDKAHELVTQWARAVPEFATQHEMGGTIPAECGALMAPSFISDHNASLHQNPSYQGWHASADLTPAYEWHKLTLQILQWKNPRGRWLLKAPAHQNALETLLKVYPDALIVQTHRDPIKCMASATNLMGCLYYMRSDKAFDASAFDDFLFGEATANRLNRVMQQRQNGTVPESQIADSRYQDLMSDPIACVGKIYAHFGLSLSDSAIQAMQTYLESKPQNKVGEHRYTVSKKQLKDRKLFQTYQKAHNVPNEV